jgi:truncated hemoglobin YjbI
MEKEKLNQKPDITNRADIELLVNSFYAKVKEDKTIGFFFYRNYSG